MSSETPSTLSTDAFGDTLLRIARNAIGERFAFPAQAVADFAELGEAAATFVTLTQQGQLRGCIGSLEAHRPLARDVAANALAAAFHDPRFRPLGKDEFVRTRVEVSLLTPAEPFPVRDEADALARLRPLVDGLILSYRGRRATFLPQVWESLRAPGDFLAQLKLKAGLPADFWHADIVLARYAVRKWHEAAR
ncbi:MAG TPA: AmmeMemoRadiSam system protein A [Accumulibacter sp.]|uniref:AmmeMemoRadiSam system protein A n=1 Tax=Accumulibacter sp. TaxID=2053492 RepID=UPI00287964B5|nr:AmmeMemoRadiSam system protein A [Accumulibacter sp.]MDS4055044.1 AmmeMemoRadiSam system protein A [Accumulibacter sp.]HMV05966.1 AmmeMemoRadiSam system protein A [Accumulibacter sp.]HMW80482.1 AmmeMemoRadiSam system protein A [Accumulibacter sp.]HMX68735.1 AmmeMemoRadiSam system protein A [Accumulibacter sp.]HNB68200.1 AmmeMemoRadiSam system protein A [Accumulibacter sp.]